MNLTITQDNSRTETINSTIIDRLYEIAFAASTDPNSTVSLTGRLESPTGYAAKIEWLNTNFSPDLTITVPTSGQYILFRDPAVEAVLIAGGFSTDGVGVSLTDAADATFTSSTFNGNTDITLFPEFDLFTKANTNPPSSLFEGCSNLTEIDFSAVLKISNKEFYGCSSLTGDLSIPNLSTISDNVFGSAPITSLDLSGSTINKVGVSICNNNPSLISVKLPKTVTTYGRTWSAAPFTNCNNITTFTGFEGITVINNFQIGLHINNAIPLLSLETSELFILKASDNGASCSASLVYLPKFKYSTISEFTSYYTLQITSSFFSYQSTNNHVFNTNLMYFKDLEKIQLAMFFKTTISNLVINKATPPTFDTNVTISPSVTVIAQGNWDTKMFGNISTSTMTIYVPNSAVSTYQADPNYNSYTILGIGSLNGGVIYLTENDWVAANKPNGLIAEYLGLDNTTIINNNKTELDLFIDNNNLTCWTNPNT